jgi:hypothetical protein
MAHLLLLTSHRRQHQRMLQLQHRLVSCMKV